MNIIFLMACIVVLMWTIEKLWPANDLPKVRNWWARVVLTNTAQAGIVIILGHTYDQWATNHVIVPWALRHHMGPGLQIFVGYLAVTFIYYWWHRLRHDSRLFWKLCHQLHHSPRRMEVLMSFYKHPVEITLNGLLSSLITYLLLGCSTEAATFITLVTGIAEYFYHWNIKTPRWLGPVFQRPESHRIHHRRNHHTNNYSDIPLWDILFNTYHNPDKPVKSCGFAPNREDRFDDMLAFRDVNNPDTLALSPLHLLPTCIGCRKRFACHQAAQNKHTEPAN